MSPDEVKAIRDELGLTQEGLARALELAEATGKDTVRSWESGKREPSGPVRVALRMMIERRPRPASLHGAIDTVLDEADRLVRSLEGKSGRTIAKETRDRLKLAAESAALLDAILSSPQADEPPTP